MNFRKLSCFAAILALSLPVWAAGRSNSVNGSSVSGIVRASDGTPQMGAVVEIFASAARNITVFTNESGFYTASGLKAGTYSLRVSAPAFLPAIRERVSVRSGAIAVVNLTLTTIFDALSVTPRSTTTQDDDWAWTLRSVANRPILRAVDPRLASEHRPAVMTAGVSFVAGSNSQGYGGDSGVSTHFSFSRVAHSGGSLAFDGNVGYGRTSPAATVRATYSQNLAGGFSPEISLTARRFAPADPALHAAALNAFSVRAADSMNLADVIELKFGSELQTLQFIKRTTALLPFASAEVHFRPDTVAAYRFASTEPPSRLSSDREGGLALEPLQAGPRVSVSDFAPALQRSSHHEVSLAHRAGKNNLMLAVYRDRLHNTALVGVGDAGAAAGDVLSDPYSGTFTYQGADFRAHGVRAVWERKFASGLDATLDYAFGGVLELPEGDTATLASARNLMHATQRHALSARVSGTLPVCHTKWTTSYKWTSGHALTNVDAFNASPGQTDPFLNLVLRQPIPRMGLLPAHMEALLDLHNLLAEGYVPVMGQDRHTVYLVQSARTVRGGVAITF